jgi:hypothetical protein
MPSVFFDNPFIRWEAVDRDTARLVVPFGSGSDSLLVRFDPQTGLIESMSAQRYRDARAETKSPWTVTYRDWQWFHEVQVPTQLLMRWDDQAEPSEILTLESVEYGAQRFLASHPAFIETLNFGAAGR